jgi:DNA-binding transcriptional regulator YiaG
MPPDAIRSMRERLGLTRFEFAALYEIAENQLAQWETGRRRPSATARTLLKLINGAPVLIAKLLAAPR